MRLKYVINFLLLVAVLPTSSSWGDEPVDVAKTYIRIVADYHRIIDSTNDAASNASAGRLTRDAYRLLLQQSSGAKELSADDLYALGACNEAIGETGNAKKMYASSLAKSPTAKTHLALARVNLQDNLAQAEKHFSSAVKTDAQYPGLSLFHRNFAVAYSQQRNWNKAAEHLEKYLAYVKTLSERAPQNSKLRARHSAVVKQLDQLRHFADMTGKPAPSIKVQQWAQGKVVELASLKGKVVLIDFCAMWAQPSRERMELLKGLQQDGLEIVGLTLPHQHKYDVESDRVIYTKGLSTKDEASGIAAFAKKHEIPWRLAVIKQETVDQYGVSVLPHTLVIDKQGNVNTIILGSIKAEEDLKKIVIKLAK